MKIKDVIKIVDSSAVVSIYEDIQTWGCNFDGDCDEGYTEACYHCEHFEGSEHYRSVKFAGRADECPIKFAELAIKKMQPECNESRKRYNKRVVTAELAIEVET